MQKTGAYLLLQSLVEQGVDVVFGIPGGSTLPIYQVLPDFPIRHVLMRHEQNAAHAADGYARVSGRVGVCLVTSGPGVTNLITGLATAYADSSPVVAIVGQVATPLMGRDSFQEVDSLWLSLPITKYSYRVTSPEIIPRVIHEAFTIAKSGRPGPVLIEIPKDVQMNLDAPLSSSHHGMEPFSDQRTVDFSALDEVVTAIGESRRPVIIAGHGVLLSRGHEELFSLAERIDAPVATTLLGISGFPGSHSLNLGLLGMHGTPQANHAVHNADLILAVGTRFVDRTTGVFQGFAPGARIVHVDIDPVEIGKNIPVWRFLLGDARTALAAILERSPRMEHGDWLARIVSWTHSASLPLHHDVDTPSPRQVMEALQKVVGNDITIVADVGQNQMWAARYFIYDRPNSYHTSGGLGTMGFALPAALGAAVADPSTPVWVISGDGGFQMSQQELATLAHERIPVKIIVFNNGYLGMVRQWQQLFHQQRYVATPLGGPDLGLLAKAHGFGGTVVSKSSRVEAALLQAVSSPGPFLLEFRIAGEENVYPIVVPGGSLVDVLDRSNDNV